MIYGWPETVRRGWANPVPGSGVSVWEAWPWTVIDGVVQIDRWWHMRDRFVRDAFWAGQKIDAAMACNSF